MDPKRPWECANMSEVRTEIDRYAEIVKKAGVEPQQ